MVNYTVSGLTAYRAKAKQLPSVGHKAPHDHWHQQVFSPASSHIDLWVSFLLGPDIICMSAPSCSTASLWSTVQVTFLPAKALGPPQPQHICKLLYFTGREPRQTWNKAHKKEPTDRALDFSKNGGTVSWAGAEYWLTNNTTLSHSLIGRTGEKIWTGNRSMYSAVKSETYRYLTLSLFLSFAMCLFFSGEPCDHPCKNYSTWFTLVRWISGSTISYNNIMGTIHMNHMDGLFTGNTCKAL